MSERQPGAASHDDQKKLIKSLREILQHDSGQVDIFETHISWVLVSGAFAYKIKKAVKFDFLDFLTLKSRQFYCLEELRLNRRLAPGIYQAVVAITGNIDCPRLCDGLAAEDNPIEYAVKMRAFAQQALWSFRIPGGSIEAPEVDRLAEKMAHFHSQTACAPEPSPWSAPAALATLATENLDQIERYLDGEEGKTQMPALRHWNSCQNLSLKPVFEQRKADGFIRECHGDLHSGNILTMNGQVEVFDCIEFNECMRWIDVLSDIAFIWMDLQILGRNDLAARLLNRYLEISGDYEGCSVLRYYLIQRALVRCKVALLTASVSQFHSDAEGMQGLRAQARKYLDFAAEQTRPGPAAVIITHGFSGGGKSFIGKFLVELTGAIQIRSDIERKRSHGMAASCRAGALPGRDLYAPAVTRDTYSRLWVLAGSIARAGIAVVVDATFLKRQQRSLFQNLASALDIPFLIVDVRASEPTLRRRIAARRQNGADPSDADWAVLADQLAGDEPLSAQELDRSCIVDTDCGFDREAIRRRITQQLLDRGVCSNAYPTSGCAPAAS